MRTHVSKVLVGTASIFKPLGTLTEAEITAFDVDTKAAVTANTKRVAYAVGSPVLGKPIISAVVEVKQIIDAFKNPYEAPQEKQVSLTVDTVPSEGVAEIIKVVYHDNLSIIPNQIKQTVVTPVAAASETPTTYAAKIAAEFNAQEFRFCTAVAAANVVTFTGLVVSTSYNHIDREESVNFEVNDPEFQTYANGDVSGAYTVADVTALKLGQGTYAKVAYLEELNMGRRGYSDRRMWNDTKKFIGNADKNTTYDVFVINANDSVEGDMQDTRSNPVGIIIAAKVGSMTDLLVETDTAFTFETVPAS